MRFATQTPLVILDKHINIYSFNKHQRVHCKGLWLSNKNIPHFKGERESSGGKKNLSFYIIIHNTVKYARELVRWPQSDYFANFSFSFQLNRQTFIFHTYIIIFFKKTSILFRFTYIWISPLRMNDLWIEYMRDISF